MPQPSRLARTLFVLAVSSCRSPSTPGAPPLDDAPDAVLDAAAPADARTRDTHADRAPAPIDGPAAGADADEPSAPDADPPDSSPPDPALFVGNWTYAGTRTLSCHSPSVQQTMKVDGTVVVSASGDLLDAWMMGFCDIELRADEPGNSARVFATGLVCHSDWLVSGHSFLSMDEYDSGGFTVTGDSASFYAYGTARFFFADSAPIFCATSFDFTLTRVK